MIYIKAKFKTCRVEKIKELAKTEEPQELWQKWTIYNLSFRLRNINQKLYSNLHPHAITPYKTRDDNIFKIFLKIKNYFESLSEITHKEIYVKLKHLENKIAEIESSHCEIIPWKTLSLQNKIMKRQISNRGKEVN